MHSGVRIHLAYPITHQKLFFTKKCDFAFQQLKKYCGFAKCRQKLHIAIFVVMFYSFVTLFGDVIIDWLRHFKSTLIKNPVYICAVIRLCLF